MRRVISSCDARAFRAALRRPCQQIHHLALREIGFAPRRQPDRIERLARGVEELRRRSDSAIRLNCSLPRGVQLLSGNLPLPRQNLPYSEFSLERAQNIGAQYRIANAVEVIDGFDKTA